MSTLNEIDNLYEEILAGIETNSKIPKDVLNSFKIKESLCPDLWKDDKLIPAYTQQLKKIAKDFFDQILAQKNITIKDICLTGSLANFNWSKFSDIDLHIIIDYKDFADEHSLVKDYFWAQKALWNDQHEINIAGFPVEIYVQDINEKHEASGVYSIVKDKWLIKPQRESFQLDKNTLQDKVDKYFDQLKNINKAYENEDYQTVIDKTKTLTDKIFTLRKASLETDGEFSIENLVFKVFRRTPFLEYITNLKNKAYDKLMSLSEVITEGNSTPSGGVLLIKGPKNNDGSHRLFITITNDLIQNGKGLQMAILGNMFARVTLKHGQPMAEKIHWESPQSMLRAAGLSKRAVALHYNKTPLHNKTLRFDNFNSALSSISEYLLQQQDINWYT